MAWIFVSAYSCAPAQGSLTELYQLFGVDMPPGDIVVLIDASGSMGPSYPVVREQVVDFVASLTAAEQVCVYLFARDAGLALAGRGDEAGKAANELIPTELLPGRGTDIGLALHKGLEWLERDGASHTQALFLLTDGYHQPPPDSPFGADHQSDSDWQRLRARGYQLARSRDLRIYGLGLSERTDIELLRYVFPVEDTEIVVRSAANTGALLSDLRDSLRRGRLQRAVERELQSCKVSVTTAPTTGELPVIRVHNDYRHLPVRLSELRVTNVHVSRAGGGDTPQHVIVRALEDLRGTVIAPASTMAVRLHADLTTTDMPIRILDQQRQYTVNCTVEPVLDFAVDADGLDLDTPWMPRVETVDITATVVERVPGLWSRYWRLLALAALVLVVVGIVWIGARARRPIADGELRYTVGQDGPQRSVRLDGQRKKIVTLGPSDADVDIVLTGLPADSAVSFRVVAAGKWQVEAIATGGPALRYRGTDVQRVSLRNGTRFQVGDVQFEYVNERLSREI